VRCFIAGQLLRAIVAFAEIAKALNGTRLESGKAGIIPVRLVSLGELRDHLRGYIGYARGGERIVVLEDERPAAMLVPIEEQGSKLKPAEKRATPASPSS
jgi:antitoxin (DNA-binding transcriptional repressor) of toxin-antitoxin stability system